nr:PREDICTED: uncharacterized protein LOC109624861 [Paralichthys olivaceus]
MTGAAVSFCLDRLVDDLKHELNQVRVDEGCSPSSDGSPPTCSSSWSTWLHSASCLLQDFTQLIDGVSQVDRITKKRLYRDIGACRHSGAVYKPNTTTCNPDNSSVTCSSLLEVTVNPCGGVCKCPEVATNITCTVTGSTVINFFGNATSIPDRCAYTLISHSGVQLLAVFQDRRRKDVSLLDHVILRMDGPGVNISLGQGGSLVM